MVAANRDNWRRFVASFYIIVIIIRIIIAF